MSKQAFSFLEVILVTVDGERYHYEADHGDAELLQDMISGVTTLTLTEEGSVSGWKEK